MASEKSTLDALEKGCGMCPLDRGVNLCDWPDCILSGPPQVPEHSPRFVGTARERRRINRPTRPSAMPNLRRGLFTSLTAVVFLAGVFWGFVLGWWLM